eukprot:441587_1
MKTLYVYIWFHFHVQYLTTQQSNYYYVASNGINHINCGSQQFPCGSMSYAYSLRTNISAAQSAEIIVQGQNIDELSLEYPCTPNFNHLPSINVLNIDPPPTIITFDTHYIHKMSDWYLNYTKCVEYQSHAVLFYINTGTNRKITLNNLIVDNIEFNSNITGIINAYSQNATITLNNATFHNIIISDLRTLLPQIGGYAISGLITAKTLIINECEFFNISNTHNTYYTQIGFIGLDLFAEDYGLFQMTHSYIHNINSTDPFIFRWVDATTFVIYPVFLISNCTFSDISTKTTIIWSRSNYINTDVVIEHSLFQYIQHGSILRVVNANVYISNTTFIISQLLSNHREYTLFDVEEPALLYLTSTFTDRLYMDNIDIYYKISYILHSYQCAMSRSFYDALNDAQNMGYIDLLFWCKSPISFLVTNDAISILNNFNVYSDMNDDLMEQYQIAYARQISQYHQYLFIEEQLNNINNVTTGNLFVNNTYFYKVFVRFMYYNDPWSSFISTHGSMTLYNVNIFGAAIACQIIYIKQGSIYIDKLITHYKHNPFALNIHKYITTFAASTNDAIISFIMHNSKIMGAQLLLAFDNSDARIINTTMSHTQRIIATTTSHNLYFEACTFEKMGLFYSDPQYFLYICTNNVNTVLNLASKNIIMLNNTFRFYDPLGFIQFQPIYYKITQGFDVSDDYLAYITMIDNVFHIETDGIKIDINNNPFIFQPLTFAWCQYLSVNFSIASSRFADARGLIKFEHQTQVQLIGNMFYDNINSFSQQRKVPYIYINNQNKNCMTGNYFENYAFYLERNSSILSCNRNQMQNIFEDIVENDKCWNGTLGQIDYTYESYEKYDIFASTTNYFKIFETSPNTYYEIYHGIFDYGKYISFGNLLMIDSIQISKMNISFIIPTECDIKC